VGVIDAVLALLHLDLGSSSDTEHRNTTRKLCEPLLQLLPIVIRGGFLDLRLDLGDVRTDVRLLTGATHDSGVLFDSMKLTVFFA
jgi:hypothetical protein